MMAKDSLKIDRFDGLSTLFSADKLPVTIAQKLVNMRPAHKLGRLVKRLPYSDQLTSGLTSLKRLKEFINKNAETLLMVMDGNTLEESVYSSGYGAIGAITNDERTAGSTIDGDNFNPIIANKELRAGAGTSASTQRPLWYGYIPERNRYLEPDTATYHETIAADRYLDLQSYKDIIKSSLFSTPTTSIGPNTKSVGGFDKDNGDKGYILISPIMDGYQKGFPEIYWPFATNDALMNILYDYTFLFLQFKISEANAEKLKRMTGFDIFFAQTKGSLKRHKFLEDVAYWIGRVKFDENGEYFLNQTGTLDNTLGAEKITIASAADWHTFPLSECWCYDSTNDKYYLIDTDVDNAGSRELTTRAEGDTITDAGAASLHFFFGWFKNGTDYYYHHSCDNYYIPAGSEMYEYLNIPTGDLGLDDFRYKYSAYNGNRLLIGGMPTDTNFTYYSANEAPDIVPSLNIFRHRDDVVGLADVSQNFLVFTKRGIERIAIFGNAQAQQDDNYHDAKLVSHKAIAKVNDDLIVFCAHDSFYAVTGRQVVNIGEHLREWFEEKLTKAQKEACVAGFNDLHNEVWFSFPTYTDSYYTAGVVMVFDLEGYNKELASPWWFIKTDVAITCLEANLQYHLLGGAATKIVDFDGNGTETLDTVYRIKMLKGFIPGKKVRWNEIFVDSITSDSITCNLYFDGSATAVALTLNTDLKGMIRYLKETLEIELTTSASDNTVEHSSVLLTFGHKRT